VSGFQFRFAGVSKSYGKHAALADVSLTIGGGAHTVILGASGCGKTTLLRLLAGLEPPTAGDIFLDDEAISRPDRILVPPHLRGVGMVFQDLALWPNLNAAANILLGLAGSGLTPRDAKARAREALELCGIADLAQRKPGQLSGGQQQRLALARAVAVRPRLLVLDEPFSGVDLVNKALLLQEIRALAAAQNLTVLLVSHDPVEAAMLCSTAIVLASGRVQETGSLADLLDDPKSEIMKVCRTHLRSLK
jgi:ABC-type Fe3+/spermidine/putrescine transport system ATPase subunit